MVTQAHSPSRQECFNSPYGTQFFAEYAEPIPGPTTELLSRAARDANVYLIGGSHPERDAQGRLFNTSTVFDRTGKMIAVHRKVPPIWHVVWG